VKDWRRINVSFTRARSKLIIFGSRKTLQASPLLAEFFNLVESRDWILRLPPNAETIHNHLIDSGSRSGKREADDLNQKENLDSSVGRPYKKLKLKKTMAEDGVLRGRPILQDLVNGDK
jgi:DNA replication ATP-dependent helicase Dna2